VNKDQAYRLGVASGYEAGIFGDLTAKELSDEDAFVEAAAEICDNKRQYADSPTYDFARRPNSGGLFDAFDKGETVGIRRAWRQRHKTAAGTGQRPG
jgi:hypothetical protein